MIFHKKPFFRILAVLALIILLTPVLLSGYAEKTVSGFLEKKLPPHIELTYEKLNVNLLTGSVDFTNLVLHIKNKDTLPVHTVSTIKALNIDGISYRQFAFNNTIEITNLEIDGLRVEHHPKNNNEKLHKKSLPVGHIKLLKTVLIDKLEINNGEFSLIKTENDSIKVHVGEIDLDVFDIKTDSSIINNRMPVAFENYSFHANNFFADLGTYETLDIESLSIDPQNISIRELNLKPKYTKLELSKKINKERDHMTLKIPELEIMSVGYGFHESRFHFTSDSIAIRKLALEIYRDKLVADDLSHKPLYGALLKKLPIDLNVSKMSITDGHIGYEEHVKAGQGTGRIFFDDLEMDILNLNNHAPEPEKIQINAKTQLMGKSPLHLDWSFNTHNSRFDASGSLSNFSGPSVNSFLVPNLNADAKGTIDNLFFTISGDSKSSTGQMKMKYHDFKFEVFRKKTHKVNKVLTTLGGILINDGSKADEQGYRFGRIHVERNPSKSFFNYLWLNVEHGIISTLTGSGKQKR